VKFISDVDSRVRDETPIFAKPYVWLFLICIILIVIGIIISGSIAFIPSDMPYDDYLELASKMQASSTITLNIGIALFALSAFLGALMDRTLADQPRKGLLQAAGVAVFALVIYMLFVPLFSYY